MKTLVTGATGFVGQRLLSRLDRPVVLSRDADGAREQLAEFNVTAFEWHATDSPPPAEAFEGVEAVVHLAGEPIAEGRWTAAKKKRLRDSRVIGTRHLVDGMLAASQKPRVFVSTSAVGYYGDRGEETVTESTPPASDFLGEICVAWEEESQRASAAGIRVANPRTGIVLGPDGGALQKMLTPFKLGLGAPLGNGRQWMPWIHIDDLVGLIRFAIENENVIGPFNAAAPGPVTNRHFTKSLGKALHRPTIFPSVPGFMVRLMFGQFAEVLLGSQRVVPAKIENAGYSFQYADIDDAFADIFK